MALNPGGQGCEEFCKEARRLGHLSSGASRAPKEDLLASRKKQQNGL